jgi:aspartate 1-decarboxylase
MLKKVLCGKIHHARITQSNLNYVGSITIDETLLRASGMVANEFVLIADLDNGARFETYVIKGPAGSGIIGINGAAAHLVNVGDRIIIFSMGYLETGKLEEHFSKVVICGDKNQILENLEYPTSLDLDLGTIPTIVL